MSNDPRIHDPGMPALNEHSHQITGHGHTHAIVDEDYLGAHLLPPTKNCRCVMLPVADELVMRDAARAEGEFAAGIVAQGPLICDPVVEVKPPAELTRVITVTVKLEPAELEEITQRMRETIAEAYGLPMRMLFGGDDVRDEAREREGRALMTVAPFPHTPE
jgi:hypothetical protein